MPCPDGFTDKQCALRDHLAKKLESDPEFKGDPWAVATAHVERMKARKKARNG